MAMPLLPLAQAVWGGVMSIIVTLAQNIGGDVVAERFTRVFANHALERQVTQAVDRAYKDFAREIHDPELVVTLERDARFSNDPQVVKLLSEVATQPQFEKQQIAALAHEMHAIAPHISAPRCEYAARVLIEAIHVEVSTIKQLQLGLLYLRDQQILAAIERQNPPPYVPGLRESIIRQADALQRELGHHYIASAHLLYALIVLPQGVARAVLERQHVTAEEVKAAVKRCVKAYEGAVQNAMSAGATTALDEAMQVARRRHAPQTRDDHVLEVLATRVIQGGEAGEGGATLGAVFKLLGLSARDVLGDVIRAGQVESQIQSSLDVLSGEIGTA